MKRTIIEEDITVMNEIERCLIENINPIGCTLSYSGNTTTINYNHLFQYAGLNLTSYTVSIDLNDIK